MKTCCIVVAAGRGERLGANRPKQFLEVCGKPLLMHSVARLKDLLGDECTMVLVLGKGQKSLWEDLCKKHKFKSPPVVEGGDTRTRSVANALTAIPQDADAVLVHDGVRPLVTRAVVEGVLAALDTHMGAVPAVEVADSLRQRAPGGGWRSVDRSLFRYVQTPQGFRADAFRKAYTCAADDATDDAALLERAGFDDIAVTPGDRNNIKITYPADLFLAEKLLADEP